MNYCIKHNMLCELANAYGYCQVTACSKYLEKNKIIYSEQINFPQTIGDITFYSSKELIKWVEEQQKINEDSDYGIGNWC